MGGDHGPSVTVPAALKMLSLREKVHIILVGDQPAITRILASSGREWSHRVTIIPTTQVIGMDESPVKALRSKSDSSMRVALDLVQRGEAHACVSAGNTGALMVIARYVLKTLPGVDRPAIIAALPTARGRVYVLDLGANVDCTPLNLLQFAVMGSALASIMEGIASPRVTLLNIGAEEIKGNELVKQSHKLFSASLFINYTGFMEGNALFEGGADVVVCDGFVGNVALKTTEGIAMLLQKFLKDAFQKQWFTKLLALPLLPVIKKVRKQIDPDENNGASLIGLQGAVIKSHGRAGVDAFCYAIQKAIVEVEKDINRLICHNLSNLQQQKEESVE